MDTADFDKHVNNLEKIADGQEIKNRLIKSC
jgi:hypothetical protein